MQKLKTILKNCLIIWEIKTEIKKKKWSYCQKILQWLKYKSLNRINNSKKMIFVTDAAVTVGESVISWKSLNAQRY